MAGERFFQPGQSQYVSQFVPTEIPFDLMQKKVDEADAKTDALLAQASALGVSPVDALEHVTDLDNNQYKVQDKQIMNQIISQFTSTKEKVMDDIINGNVLKNDYATSLRELSAQKTQSETYLGQIKNRYEGYKELQKQLAQQKLEGNHHLGYGYQDNILKMMQANPLESSQIDAVSYGKAVDQVGEINKLSSSINSDKTISFLGFDDVQNALVTGKDTKEFISFKKASDVINSKYQGSDLEKDTKLKAKYAVDFGNITYDLFNTLSNITPEARQYLVNYGSLSEEELKLLEDPKAFNEASKSTKEHIYKEVLDRNNIFAAITQSVFEKRDGIRSPNDSGMKKAEEASNFGLTSADIGSRSHVPYNVKTIEKTNEESLMSLVQQPFGAELLQAFGIDITGGGQSSVEGMQQAAQLLKSVKYENGQYLINGSDGKPAPIESVIEAYDAILKDKSSMDKTSKTNVSNNFARKIYDLAFSQNVINVVEGQVINTPEMRDLRKQEFIAELRANSIFSNSVSPSEINQIFKNVDINDKKAVLAAFEKLDLKKSVVEQSGYYLSDQLKYREEKVSVNTISDLYDKTTEKIKPAVNSKASQSIASTYQGVDNPMFGRADTKVSTLHTVPGMNLASASNISKKDQEFVLNAISKSAVQQLPGGFLDEYTSKLGIDSLTFTKMFTDIAAETLKPEDVMYLGSGMYKIDVVVLDNIFKTTNSQVAKGNEQKIDDGKAFWETKISDTQTKEKWGRNEYLVKVDNLDNKSEIEMRTALFMGTYKDTGDLKKADKKFIRYDNVEGFRHLEQAFEHIKIVENPSIASPVIKFQVNDNIINSQGKFVKNGNAGEAVVSVKPSTTGKNNFDVSIQVPNINGESQKVVLTIGKDTQISEIVDDAIYRLRYQ
jgi:hypothetical protein